MSASEISAPRWRFLDGLCKIQGYNVVTEGERVTVAFEPWALEQVDPFDIPCLRLEFRQVDGRIVLERFTIEKDRKSTRLNSSHDQISYAVFCLKKKNTAQQNLSSPAESASK